MGRHAQRFGPFEIGDRPRVVVVGAGFGGLATARHLAGKKIDGQPIEVLIVDRHNYHLFTPLLYQVAAAEITPEQIAYPIRSIFRSKPSVQVLAAEVQGIDRDQRLLQTSRGAVPYDWLVVATGSRTHFMGVPGAAEFCFGLKDLDEAIELRNHVLARVEQAAAERDDERRRELLTFAIVGGGPTGVEFAGALAVLFRGPLARDYPELDLEQDARIVLAEAGDRLLPAMSQASSAEAEAGLRDLGVDVMKGAMVSEATAGALRLKDGREIRAQTSVWTAGVQGDPEGRSWVRETERGRALVEEDLLARGDQRVFVLGDLARTQDQAWPMMAPVAMQQGKHVAQNIERALRGKEMRPFRYRDYGSMCALGRNRAVADMFGRHFRGLFAWIIWVMVHIAQLIGFRNRVFVLSQWAWNYVFYQRSTRMILPPRKSACPATGSAQPQEPLTMQER